MWTRYFFNFYQKVTNAEKGVYVVLHLYQNYIEKSMLVNQILERVAKKYTDLKFLKILADKCIENYPDVKVPCLIIYKDGELKHTMPRFDKKYSTISDDTFEDLLASIDLIEKKNTMDLHEAKELKSKF